MIHKLFNKKIDRLEDVNRAVMRGVPRDWRAVWVQVECDGSSTSVGRFVSTDSMPQPTYFEVPTFDFARFTALNGESDPPWTTMTIMYERYGGGAPRFKAEAGYEPVPIDYAYERRKAWKAKYLPRH